MERDTLIIRGNITPAINRYEQLAKERAERERVEREERWAREREERAQKEAKWKEEHPILCKYTYMSYYNYDTYSWTGYLYNVNFYEWSNIDNSPRRFNYSMEFYKFLDSCKINLTDAQNERIKNNMNCHVTCIPGTHDLIVALDYDELKREYQKLSNLAKILEPVPEPNNVPKVLSCKVYDSPITYP